jgi:hypothetical protein
MVAALVVVIIVVRMVTVRGLVTICHMHAAYIYAIHTFHVKLIYETLFIVTNRSMALFAVFVFANYAIFGLWTYLPPRV